MIVPRPPADGGGSVGNTVGSTPGSPDANGGFPPTSTDRRRRCRILSVIGTRPEAIKMAPVILEMRQWAAESVVCVTSQHRELMTEVLDVFGIHPDYDLDVMTGTQTPTEVTARVMLGLEGVLRKEEPDWVLVQGDTASTMASAVTTFQAGYRLAHIEAGLRSHDLRHPWPEEAYRRIASLLADLHFAPTTTARDNLLREGVVPERVIVTGNPGIDALRLAIPMAVPASETQIPPGKRMMLVTAHRRESFGAPLEAICHALVKLADRYADQVHIVYPMHPNPQVSGPVTRLLGGHAGITLTDPVAYLEMVSLLQRSYLVLTDSGGLQEEAPALGKPVLVMRETTERPEGIDAGATQLIGRDTPSIVAAVSRILDDEQAYDQMAQPRNLFGDGHSARRIVLALLSQRFDRTLNSRLRSSARRHWD